MLPKWHARHPFSDKFTVWIIYFIILEVDIPHPEVNDDVIYLCSPISF